MKLTNTQTAALLFIAKVPGKVPARTSARTFKALDAAGATTRNMSGQLVPTTDGYNHLRSLGHDVTDAAASRKAEKAAQNLLNVIQDSYYRMTPERKAAKAALLDAIAADYPNLPAADVYDNWSFSGMASIRHAAALTQQDIEDADL